MNQKFYMQGEKVNPNDLLRQSILVFKELERRRKRLKIDDFYPEFGPLRRELYRPHMEFFKAGATCRERAIIAANRIGKSEGIGGYEVTLHLTGDYPDWWIGKKFNRPVKVWACGSTGQTVRDIVQFKLLGEPGFEGTGMVPGDKIIKSSIKRKAGGVPDAIESFEVKYSGGGRSRCVFKSYDQKRKAFEGTEQDVIWLDEECPMDIYAECLIRTMTTKGLILLTFTPLMGLTQTVLNFMEEGQMPRDKRGMPADLIGGYDKKKFIINATWDDAPHLTQEDKEDIWRSTPVYLRDARAKGIPQLGAGAIYPILEENLMIPDFIIPPWYNRVYGLDVGWNATAAVWLAHDLETDVAYITSVYKQGQRDPASHVQMINARGAWIPGVIDPSAAGAGKLKDGRSMIDEYLSLGLNLGYARHAVEAGIFAVFQRMTTGRLKVFESCSPWFAEFRIYRRDENGKVASGQEDHLMDAMRYGIMTGLDIATSAPYEEEEDYLDFYNPQPPKKSGYFGVY